MAASENRSEIVPVPPEKPWLFKPGNSANPGGRPKGLAQLAREKTRDGAELVEFMYGVLHNKRQPMRLRMEAAGWLADRGFGKALQQVEVGNADGEPFTHRILIDYVTEGRDPDADGAAE